MAQHSPRQLHNARNERCTQGKLHKHWIGDQGSQYLMKYEWKEGEWEDQKQ